jgi:hypothetical protein
MNNLFYSLPDNIIANIYEYDSTYRKVYDLVILEMMIKFRYVRNWNIIYNREMNFLRTFYSYASDEIHSLFMHG